MSKSNNIEPKIILTIDLHNYNSIPITVRSIQGDILYLGDVPKYNIKQFKVRQDVINNILLQYKQFNIDTILFEQNKLFIDKIDRYPDPAVLRDVVLGFGVQISIEDNFYNGIPYILSIPEYEWKPKIINSNNKYSIDMYKSHVQDQFIYHDHIKTIDKNNYYKLLCLSESVNFDALMNKKYQINRGD